MTNVAMVLNRGSWLSEMSCSANAFPSGKNDINDCHKFSIKIGVVQVLYEFTVLIVCILTCLT